MARAVEFYRSAFGMSVTLSHDSWSTLTLGNLNLGLHWNEGAPVLPTVRDARL